MLTDFTRPLSYSSWLHSSSTYLQIRFYISKISLGYRFPELYKLISSVTLSFAATVIWVALKQWESGELNKKYRLEQWRHLVRTLAGLWCMLLLEFRDITPRDCACVIAQASLGSLYLFLTVTHISAFFLHALSHWEWHGHAATSSHIMNQRSNLWI
jgi:hypothetical protein